MHDTDWQRIAPEVARQLLGEPTSVKSNEWRWGNKGSMVFTLDTGQFYDFEEGVGFGVAGLIKHLGKNVEEVLKQHGFERPLPHLHSLSSSSPATKSSGRSFSREQMVDLWKQAVIKMKYSEDFMVLRFPEGHHIRQKYAPFTKQPNGSWSMNRPEGLMPLFITNNYPDKPVLISEGEKALYGSKQIYDYDVCTWHGGVNSWDKTDWSPIYGREVWMWPDNDAAGKKAAFEISEHLRANNCTKVKIITPPEDFADKDDLHDAYESKYFDNSQSLEFFVKKQKEKIPKGALRFERADFVISQIENPDWLIKNCFEREKLITVFGEPKSGKSFIAIAMACAIARGGDFYGHKATQAPVVYLAGEGVSGIRQRLGAYNQYFKNLEKAKQSKDVGVLDGAPLDGAPLFLSNRGARINEADELVKLETEIGLLQKEVGNIGLVILDTFQRCFSGDENSAQEVNKFIKAADQLIQTFNCTVLMVHHTGRGNKTRARGSSVLDASIDGEFIVERNGTKADNEDSMLVTMKQTKNKDGMGMAEKKFEFHEEALEGKGFKVTSGLLIETDEVIADSQEAMQAINNAVDKKIAGLMYSMDVGKTEKDRDIWYTAGSFEHHASFNISGKEFSRTAINNSFKRLEAANVLVHAKRDKDSGKLQGCRLVEFREYFDYEL